MRGAQLTESSIGYLCVILYGPQNRIREYWGKTLLTR
ncbi:hypothetical protein SAMN04515695_1330 [Pseudovibrio sp. Tun.PSC04-5.I4]|nr:hypothetical protein SAMN04515695_1330 [Pseudovibrio sp. Tun.PSC04-5.I4]